MLQMTEKENRVMDDVTGRISDRALLFAIFDAVSALAERLTGEQFKGKGQMLKSERPNLLGSGLSEPSGFGSICPFTQSGKTLPRKPH